MQLDPVRQRIRGIVGMEAENGERGLRGSLRQRSEPCLPAPLAVGGEARAEPPCRCQGGRVNNPRDQDLADLETLQSVPPRNASQHAVGERLNLEPQARHRRADAVHVQSSFDEPARDHPGRRAELRTLGVARHQRRPAVCRDVVVERPDEAHVPPDGSMQHADQRGFVARLAESLLVLVLQPRDHIVQQLVALAELACHRLEPPETAALVLCAGAARARLIAGRHAGRV